jgi:alkylhydroperoxidase family enzyme
MQDIEWLDPLVEPERSRELERFVKQRAGFAPSAIGYFAACPWIGRATVEMLLAERVHIDHDLADLVALVVSQESSCRFCYATARLLLRILGMPEARIRTLEQDLETAQLDERTRLALDFARRLSRSNPLPSRADKKPLLEAGYSEAAIVELAFVASENVFHNRVSTLAAMPPQRRERLGRSRLLGLVRPLMARRIRALRKQGRPEWLSDEFKRGPYTYLVVALDGLPGARILRGILDEAWASPHLSRRAKALILAVIARGLGCSHSEREAFRLLAAEGLETDEADEILAHLGARGLDPIEARIVPYARETIWCQPALVQRQGRELQEHLSPAQFFEVIGIASLANMLCRLAIVLDEP